MSKPLDWPSRQLQMEQDDQVRSKLWRVYGRSQAKRDAFGRRPALPSEIQRAVKIARTTYSRDQEP
jgi:hypothetical protein